VEVSATPGAPIRVDSLSHCGFFTSDRGGQRMRLSHSVDAGRPQVAIRLSTRTIAGYAELARKHRHIIT
jgi:hypothetical protein